MAATYEHPVEEEHEAKLKTILKLDPGPELPKDVRDTYFMFKRPLDRIGGQITDSDLVYIALQSTGSTPEDTKYSFVHVLDDIRKGVVPVEIDSDGTFDIEGKWRGKWLQGRFQRVSGGKIVVVLDDNTAEERELAPDKVRLPE